MKTIALALQKGGCGKTTCAVSLAAELSKKFKTVIIDADPQGNATGSLINTVSYELADYLMGKCSLDDVVSETSFENLYVIPTIPILEDSGEDGLNKLRSYKASPNPSRNQYDMDDLIQKLSEYFDYCIIDTSPAFDLFEENIFFACDEVIGVIKADQFSNDGLTIFGMNLADFKKRRRCAKPSFSKIILNGYDARYKFHKQMYEEITRQNNFKSYVVPVHSIFGLSQSSQTPIQFMKDIKEDERLKDVKNTFNTIAGEL